ncbi:hypothetical protein [Saccharopolyspora cebuensis]|uniref:Uncharacterized protein n=1 Tax=Saccharopolyspora cebuensis TaxID=418759 RepID=A0ABV4CII4_9PSEU
MFWLHIGTFVLINVLLLALIGTAMTGRALPAQHAGAGEGGYSVWQLIAAVEAERDCAPPPRFPCHDPDAYYYDDEPEPTGRHHLRAEAAP